MIKGLDKDRKRIEKSFKIAKKHMRESARSLAHEQERMIETSQAPDGSAQKANAPRYAKRKKKPPLGRTGRLKDATAWRVRARGGDEIVLQPPRDRVVAVELLTRRGFSLVTDTLPRDYDDRLQEELDAKLKKAGV